MCSSLPERAPKSQLAVEQPWTGGFWDVSHPEAKEKLQPDGRRGTIIIRSNPIPGK